MSFFSLETIFHPYSGFLEAHTKGAWRIVSPQLLIQFLIYALLFVYKREKGCYHIYI